MKRLTERFGDGYIAIEWCTSAYKDVERKSTPAANAIVRLAAYEDAMPLERAQELAQAEKDGRLVVLPCKPGQTIWGESCIRGMAAHFEAPDIEWIIENTERFGTEIFLTREEAEAAPKKREADNEAN